MLLLSYPLSRDVPVFPGTPPLKVIEHQTIEVDGSRSSMVEFNTHTGSHLDLPAHFHEGGEGASLLPRLIELSPARCLDMPAEGDAPLYLDDLPNDLDGVEALLLRTGAHRLRDSYPQQYREKHPWLHPDAAERLRRLPRLKAIGFDFISAASPSSPEEGAAVHKTLLSPERPIMIMEDLDLSDGRLPERGWTLYIVPMFTADVESTPVTVLAVPL